MADECYVSILCTFRNFFDWIVKFVSSGLLEFLFQRNVTFILRILELTYRIDCCFCISRTFRILFHHHCYFSISHAFWISSLNLYVSISRLLRFSFTGLFRKSLAHFQDSLSFHCHVSISCTFRILFHSIVTLVSSSLFEISFIRLLDMYLAHFQVFSNALQDTPSFVSYFSNLRIRMIVQPTFDCYISISCTFRILNYSIGTLTSVFSLLLAI